LIFLEHPRCVRSKETRAVFNGWGGRLPAGRNPVVINGAAGNDRCFAISGGTSDG
jgi:hypothetical protein